MLVKKGLTVNQCVKKKRGVTCCLFFFFFVSTQRLKPGYEKTEHISRSAAPCKRATKNNQDNCHQQISCLQEKQRSLEAIVSQLLSLFILLKDHTKKLESLSIKQKELIISLSQSVEELTQQLHNSEQFFEEKISILTESSNDIFLQSQDNLQLLYSLINLTNSLQEKIDSDKIALHLLSDQYGCSD